MGSVGTSFNLPAPSPAPQGPPSCKRRANNAGAYLRADNSLAASSSEYSYNTAFDGKDYSLIGSGAFRVYFDYREGGELKVATRYWDETRVKTRQKVHRIDAYLSANLYFLRIAGGASDIQLRVHGGIAAKDILGKFENYHGYDRADIGAIPPSSNAKARSNPGLWIVHDPRFQYVTDFQTEDIFSILSVE